MDRKIIFDLGEVLIMGLVGVEKELSPILDIREKEKNKCLFHLLSVPYLYLR